MIGTRDKTPRPPKRDPHEGIWNEMGPGFGGGPRPKDPHDGGGGLGPKNGKRPIKGF